MNIKMFIENVELFQKEFDCTDFESDYLNEMLAIYLESNGENTTVFNLIANTINSNKEDTEIDKDLLSFIKEIKIVKNLIKKGFIESINYIEDIPDLEFIFYEIKLSKNFINMLNLKDDEKDLDKFLSKDFNNYSDFLKLIFLYNNINFELKSMLNEEIDKKSIIYKKKEETFKEVENVFKKTKNIKNPYNDLVKKYKLDNIDEIILISILYASNYNYIHIKSIYDFPNLITFNLLLDLISENHEDRISKRNYLDNNNVLINNQIILLDDVITTDGVFELMFSLDEKDLVKLLQLSDSEIVSIKKDEKNKSLIELDTYLEKNNVDIFEVIKTSTLTEKKIILNNKIKESLDIIKKQNNSKFIEKMKQWGYKESEIGSKILFYGEPGTGKSASAVEIARSLDKNIIKMDCSNILNEYVGKSEQNVKEIFKQYKTITEKTKEYPILLLDEIDQFLSKRTSNTDSVSKMHNQIQNIFLDEIEKFDGIIIGTTNLLTNLDSAFSRRFNYKIEFKKPEKEERLKIWKTKLPKNINLDKNVNFNTLSNYELTGAQIELIVKNTLMKIAILEKNNILEKDFIEEIDKELNNSFDKKDRKLGFK